MSVDSNNPSDAMMTSKICNNYLNIEIYLNNVIHK